MYTIKTTVKIRILLPSLVVPLYSLRSFYLFIALNDHPYRTSSVCVHHVINRLGLNLTIIHQKDGVADPVRGLQDRREKGIEKPRPEDYFGPMPTVSTQLDGMIKLDARPMAHHGSNENHSGSGKEKLTPTCERQLHLECEEREGWRGTGYNSISGVNGDKKNTTSPVELNTTSRINNHTCLTPLLLEVINPLPLFFDSVIDM